MRTPGYDKGWADGFMDGSNKLMRIGYDDDLTYEEGWKTGYEEGYTEGYEDGEV